MEDVGHADQVLSFAAEPVLRAEEAREPDAVGGRDQLGRVPEPLVHRGRVGHQPDPQAPERGEAVADEHVEAGVDAGGEHWRAGNGSLEAGRVVRYNPPTPKHTALRPRREAHVPRPLATLSLAAVLSITAGCKKPDAGPAAGQPAPADGPTGAANGGPTGPRADVETVVDLSPYLVRGEIRVPAGTVVERRAGGAVTLRAGPGFVVEVDPIDRPLAAGKAEWEPRLVPLGDGRTDAFGRRGPHGGRDRLRVRVAGPTRRARTDSAALRPASSAASRSIGWRAAASLAQTNALRDAAEREEVSLAGLAKAGCSVSESADGPSCSSTATGSRTTTWPP